MKDNLSVEQIFEPAFSIICELLRSTHKATIISLLELGILDCFQAVFENRSNDHSAIRDALWAIGNLASDNNPECLKGLIDSDILVQVARSVESTVLKVRKTAARTIGIVIRQLGAEDIIQLFESYEDLFSVYLKGLNFSSDKSDVMDVLQTLEHLCRLDSESEVSQFKTLIEENGGYEQLNDLHNSPNGEIRKVVNRINEHLDIQFKEHQEPELVPSI